MYIYIGDIVSTHGIKGEIRVISNFKYKKEIFKKGTFIYIGKNKEKHEIITYRYHKIYDMFTLTDINDINEAVLYKNEPMYINSNEVIVDGYFDEQLIGLDVYVNETCVGKITSIETTKLYNLLVVTKNNIRNLVPNIKEFVEKVDLKNNKIYIKEMEGLFDEN